MINAVSGVSFKGEGDKDLNALINSPGKFSAAPAATMAPAADKVDLSTSNGKKEKNNTAAVVGGTLAALAAVWVGLGIAVGKGKLADWKLAEGVQDAGWGAKAKNLVYKIGESAKKAYDSTLGKWFGKKADDAAKASDDASKAGGETPKAGGDDAPKAGGETPKAGGDDAPKAGGETPKADGDGAADAGN